MRLIWQNLANLGKHKSSSRVLSPIRCPVALLVYLRKLHVLTFNTMCMAVLSSLNEFVVIVVYLLKVLKLVFKVLTSVLLRKQSSAVQHI